MLCVHGVNYTLDQSNLFSTPYEKIQLDLSGSTVQVGHLDHWASESEPVGQAR